MYMTLTMFCDSQACPDQSMHLDAPSWGLLTWVNCMAEGCYRSREDPSQIDAYLGIYVNSARCISEVKRIAGEEYEQFSDEFFRASNSRGQLLVDVMKGSSRGEKLWIAWSYYIVQRLKAAGFNDLWERKYVKASEFEALVASLSIVHFGARFPFTFEDAPPNQFQRLYQLRMHSYIGETWIRSSSVEESGAHMETDHIETKTVDIRNNYIFSPALCFAYCRQMIRHNFQWEDRFNIRALRKK
jgi:hypothetical protein